MTPRKVLPYLILFLVLAGGYWGLTWRQERREAREAEGKKVFAVKADDIQDLALRKGAEEIRLARREKDWEIVQPLKAPADQQVVTAMLATLGRLQKERDLGTVKDLKNFGLEKPALTLAFTAAGQPHQLLVGAKAPGERYYYVLRDQEPQVLLVNAGDKESLDRSLTALRDKTLMTFQEDQVKAVRLRVDHQKAELSRDGSRWRWAGHEETAVRPDRVQALLRQLQYARVREFVAEAPGNPASYGLAPRPQGEVVLETEKTKLTLYLGGKTKDGVYARLGTSGPVVLVDKDLPANLAKAAGSLEDRRLWRGDLSQVARVVWGPPAKPWVAVKEKDFWNLTGPDGQHVRQHAARVEMALRRLQDLEFMRLLPQAPGAGEEAALVTLSDASGKLLYHLGEKGKKAGKDLEVRAEAEGKAVGALISARDYDQWQGEMERLTQPPKAGPKF
jgi:hypothetical protein